MKTPFFVALFTLTIFASSLVAEYTGVRNNLAIGKPIEVSSRGNKKKYEGELAVDGEQLQASRWASENVEQDTFLNDQWLIIDLESVETIDKFRILWQRQRLGGKYDILVAGDDGGNNDDRVWTLVKEVTRTLDDDFVHTINLDAAVDARYVRFDFKETLWSTRVRDGEIEYINVYSPIEVEIYAEGVPFDPLQYSSLATNKPADASHTKDNLFNVAAQINDGLMTSFWGVPSDKNKMWASVNLEQQTLVNQFALYWHRIPPSYEIQVSDTGSGWQTIALSEDFTIEAIVDEEVKELHTIRLTQDINTQYIRVWINKEENPAESSYILQEFLVEYDSQLVAPTGLIATAGDGFISLSWDDILGSEVTSYRVYRTTSGGTYQDALAIDLTDNYYLDDTVSLGTIYNYVVVAVTADGTESEYSNEASAESLQVTGPMVHLNATNAVNLLGNPVSQWIDESGNGNNASSDEGDVYYPSESLSASGLAGLNMGSTHNNLELFTTLESDNYLDFSGSASGNTGFAILIAFKLDSIHSNHQDLFGNGSSGIYLRRKTGGGLLFNLGSERLNTSASVDPGETVVVGLNYDAASGQIELYDSESGQTLMKTIAAADFSTNGGLTIGSSGNGGRNFYGMIGEFKVYNTSLQPAFFQAEYTALEDKWISSQASPYWHNLGVDMGLASDDFDNDGKSNLLEYALGTSPFDKQDSVVVPKLAFSNGAISLSYLRRSDDQNLIYTIESCSDLSSDIWTQVGNATVTSQARDDYYDEVTNTMSLDSNETMFFRLKVTNP
ncbi:MAG: discoidin domain-containing protein [Verrucomicrobiota bacterium]